MEAAIIPMKLIKDLGTIRDSSGVLRRWCMAECSHCGSIIKHRTQSLSHKQSCGCITNRLKSEGHVTHGSHKDRLYQTWGDMKTRCNCKTNSRYHRYGGRGIKVCTEWESFPVFKK